MSVIVKFKSPAGIISLNLDRISVFQITRQRNSCELLAITPENPRPGKPYAIARRDKEWQIRDILDNLQNLKEEMGPGIIFEISDTDARRVNPA